MTNWHVQAIEMRRTMSFAAIAKVLGVSKSSVAKACKGAKPEINTRRAWQSEAREMRKTMSYPAIARHFGKSLRRVKEVCCDVETSFEQAVSWTPEQIKKRTETLTKKRALNPVVKVEKLKAGRKKQPPPDWVPQARSMRHKEMSYAAIAKICGTNKSSVIHYCRDIPVSARGQFVRTREQIERGIATQRANREKAIREGRIISGRKAKPRTDRVRAPSTPVISPIERRVRMVRRLIASDNQNRHVPITLPKLRFMEGVDP